MAIIERCRKLFQRPHRASVPQRLQGRAFDQGARGRRDAESDHADRTSWRPAAGSQSDRKAARPAAAELVETAVEETLAYYAFPEEHWRRIRTNNPLERILREIRRRTHVLMRSRTRNRRSICVITA
jgi:transposase-like protein